jgi:regulatory protein
MTEGPKKDYQRARLSAMNMLARREQSRKELENKLGTRFEIDVITRVLDDLAGEGLQSDQRYLESFVSSRINRGQGPLKISYELRNKGIGAEAIAGQLEPYSENWLDIAKDVLERKFGAEPPADFKEKQKRQRFIAGRGFPNDICYKLFD